MLDANTLLVLSDFLAGVNVVLVFGTIFLVLEIMFSLGLKGGFVLAAGWRFLFPAIAVLAVMRIYDFFLRYTAQMMLLRGMLNLVFTALLFAGVLIQYLAIRGVNAKRM